MEQIIATLKEYLKQVIDSDIEPSRRYVIQKALTSALEELEYAYTLSKANNIKLGE